MNRDRFDVVMLTSRCVDNTQHELHLRFHSSESSSQGTRVPIWSSLMKEPVSPEVTKLLESESFAYRDNVVDGFIVVLRWVWEQDRQCFDRCAKKLFDYIANNRHALIRTSVSCEPRSIRGTGYWVKTNNRTTIKQRIVREFMRECGRSAADIVRVNEELAARNGNP